MKDKMFIPKKFAPAKKENERKRYGKGVAVLKEDSDYDNKYSQGFINKALDVYQRGITDYSKKILNFSFFANCQDKDVLKRNKWKIRVQEFFCDKDNEEKLFEIAERFLVERFGEDALSRYGIPKNLKVSNVPVNDLYRDFEDYVFLHSDKYLDALIKAPKIPIEKWTLVDANREFKLYSKKVIMNVDDEIILGEFIEKINRRNSYTKPDVGNSLSFCVYYRGRVDGKFLVERWDYEPHKQHLNKLNKNGDFVPNGVVKYNTKHSHVHRNSYRQRLVFGQNISCDICPTPKNADPTKKEKRYRTFDDFQEEFFDEYNLLNSKIKYYDLDTKSLVRNGKKYCPVFDSEKGKVVHIPPAFYETVNRQYDFDASNFKTAQNLDNLEEIKVKKEQVLEEIDEDEEFEKLEISEKRRELILKTFFAKEEDANNNLSQDKIADNNLISSQEKVATKRNLKENDIINPCPALEEILNKIASSNSGNNSHANSNGDERGR